MRLIFVILLAYCSCSPKPDQVTTSGSIVLKNINIVDVEGEKILRGRDVLISGNRIEKITDHGPGGLSAPVEIDGTGKYLIPGLWDMHSHPLSERDLQLMVAHGVTGTRIMDGDTVTLRWKRQVQAGELTGPRIYTAGETFEGTLPKEMQSLAISLEGWEVTDTRQQAREAVQRHKQMGYDFIKIYNNLQDSVVEEIFAEAARQHLHVCGHIPVGTGLVKSIDLGIRSVEHLRGYIQQVIPEDAPIALGRDFRSWTLGWGFVDKVKEDAIIDLTVKKGVWNCPTFTFEMILAPKDTIAAYLRTNEALLLLDADVSEYRDRKKIPWASNFSDQDFEKTAGTLQNRFRFVGKLHSRGGKLLAGSDTHVYGPSLHRELVNFVRCGLSPGEALRTATINAALYFGIEKDHGTVEEKKISDLVILDTDPLEDIEATRSIFAVIRDGELISRERIAGIIEDLNSAEGRQHYKRRR